MGVFVTLLSCLLRRPKTVAAGTTILFALVTVALLSPLFVDTPYFADRVNHNLGILLEDDTQLRIPYAETDVRVTWLVSTHVRVAWGESTNFPHKWRYTSTSSFFIDYYRLTVLLGTWAFLVLVALVAHFAAPLVSFHVTPSIIVLKNVARNLRAWADRHHMAARSILWLVLAGVSFSISAELTRRVTHVSGVLFIRNYQELKTTIYRNQAGWYNFAALAEPGTQSPAEVYFSFPDGADYFSELKFVFPKGTKMLALWYLGWVRGRSPPCRYSGEGRRDSPPLLERNGSVTWGDYGHYEDSYWYFLFDVSASAPDSPVVCSLKTRWLSETFTTKVSRFSVPGDGPSFIGDNSPRGLIQIPMNLTIRSQRGPFEVVGGTGQFNEGRVRMQPGEDVYVRFTSFWAGQQRDWYLIMIGVFIALGAALLVEVLRPFIEKIAEERDDA